MSPSQARRQAEVVPGGGVALVRGGQLLERLCGVAELAGGGSGQGAFPFALALQGGGTLVGVFAAGGLRQAALGTEDIVKGGGVVGTGRRVADGLLQRRPRRHGPVQLQFTLGDQREDLRQNVVGLGRVQFDGLAEQQQRPGQLALQVTEAAAQVIAEGVIRADLEGFFQGGLGLLEALHLIEELGLAAPGFRVVGVGLDHFFHGLQGDLVLAAGVLLKGFFELGVNGLTAPFEFLAAAARTGGIEVERHAPPAGLTPAGRRDIASGIASWSG